MTQDKEGIRVGLSSSKVVIGRISDSQHDAGRERQVVAGTRDTDAYRYCAPDGTVIVFFCVTLAVVIWVLVRTAVIAQYTKWLTALRVYTQ